MMHSISLNGRFFRTWKGSCPGVEAELEKARAGVDGYAYNLIADGEYPEGEETSHFDPATGARIARADPPPGYKYENEDIAASLVPADGSEVLAAWIEAKCDEVDSRWITKVRAGSFAYGGFTFPTNETAQIAYSSQYAPVANGLIPSLKARAIENVDVMVPPSDLAAFALAAMAGVDAYQTARVNAKTAMRAAPTYEAALAIFNEYMEG